MVGYLPSVPAPLRPPTANASYQSDNMEVLDEKVNGGPPMEIEEIVSVLDRECSRPAHLLATKLWRLVFQTRHSR